MGLTNQAPKISPPQGHLLPESQQTGAATKRPLALVTGGSSGIGAGIAEALARDGHDLVLGYHTNASACNDWAQALTKKYGIRAVCVGGDCSTATAFSDLFAAVDAFDGCELRVAVHAAGQEVGITGDNSRGLGGERLGFGDGSMIRIDDQGAETVDTRQLVYYADLYAKGFVEMSERAIVRMNGRGAIVGITAPGCSIASSPRDFYDMPMTGKAVMEQMARYYARTLASRRITVNCVSPGITVSRAWERASVDIHKLAQERSPMGVPVQAHDIGSAVAFLCSERACFITGITLPVDAALHLVSTQPQTPRLLGRL